MVAKKTNHGASDGVRTAVTILLLIFLMPVGIILMWFWPKWSQGVKIAITILFGLGIFILPVFLSLVLVVINPARQFAQANNTQRRADVLVIITAVEQYSQDHQGQLPLGSPVPGEPPEAINSANTGTEFCNALVPTYIAALPRDPSDGTYIDCNSYDTKYQIAVSPATASESSHILVSAPGAELGVVISVRK